MTRQALLIVGFLVAAYPALAQQQKVGDLPEASNMRLVGWTDLQSRSAYQPTIHRQGDPAVALAMDGGLVGAARLQIGPADQPHVRGLRRRADLLLLRDGGVQGVRRDQKTDDEQGLPRHVFSPGYPDYTPERAVGRWPSTGLQDVE